MRCSTDVMRDATDMATPNEVLDGYLAHAEAVSHDREDLHFWAFDEMASLVSSDPETAWGVVVELVARSTDDCTLAYIAAGPLEDLLCEHAPLVIDRVEFSAANDPRFRRALVGVWGWSRMPSDVRARLDRLVSGEEPL